MPTRDGAASTVESLSRKRRLHPLAMLFPFSSYSRPPRLGRSISIPRWVIFSILFLAVLIIDVFSTSVSVRDDGAVLASHDNFTWLQASGLLVGVGIGVALLVMRWWSFRWWIDDDAIWTSGGIIGSWQRRVAFDHIVTLDRSSNPFQRICGASRIAIETTAVDQAAPDVLFGSMSNMSANLLEELLITKLVFAGEEREARRFDPLSVDHLGWGELFRAGATTFHFGRAVVILYAAALFLLEDINLRETSFTLDVWFESTALGVALAQLATVLFLGIMVVLWLVSMLYFVMSFARFRLGKHEGWLILETGVIRRSRRLIRANAIQGLDISRSPLQRYFRNKRAMLQMRLPAYGAPPIFAMVLHPAVTDAALPVLTRQIVGMDLATSDAMCGNGVHRLAAVSRKRHILSWPLRIAAVSGAVLACLLVVQPRMWWLALFPLILALPLAISGWLAWRSAGWYAGDGGWLVVQQGSFTRTSTAARVDRIQYIHWSQGVLSRANSPFSLAIAVATSGGVGELSKLLPRLFRPTDPSLVRLPALAGTDATKIAIASGFARSLPPAAWQSGSGTQAEDLHQSR